MAGFLMKERDRVKNMMVIGLTEEEKEYLHEIEIEETRYEDIDRFVAGGICDAEKACEVLGVDIDAYNRYLASGKGVELAGDRQLL